jgi:GDPmannose 4,6-dehydratase
LNPQSPYAAAKASAHLLCRSYRESYGIRIACGILFNHESWRRGASFLTRKVVDHLHGLQAGGDRSPLRIGNLKAQRDWGFAPDYVDGMLAILRQTAVRGVADEASEYRDYVLGTGSLHSVWQLVDRAFALAGYELEWNLEGDDPMGWSASFATDGETAVTVDAEYLRPADPVAIAADPSRIATELGWRPRIGLDVFLEDMLAHRVPSAASHVAGTPRRA